MELIRLVGPPVVAVMETPPQVKWDHDDQGEFVKIPDVCGPFAWSMLHKWALAVRDDMCVACGDFAIMAAHAIHDATNHHLGKPIQFPEDLRFVAGAMNDALGRIEEKAPAARVAQPARFKPDPLTSEGCVRLMEASQRQLDEALERFKDGSKTWAVFMRDVISFATSIGEQCRVKGQRGAVGAAQQLSPNHEINSPMSNAFADQVISSLASGTGFGLGAAVAARVVGLITRGMDGARAVPIVVGESHEAVQDIDQGPEWLEVDDHHDDDEKVDQDIDQGAEGHLSEKAMALDIRVGDLLRGPAPQHGYYYRGQER